MKMEIFVQLTKIHYHICHKNRLHYSIENIVAPQNEAKKETKQDNQKRAVVFLFHTHKTS